ADIKGSTELMADLDPEEARVIIDPALKLMIDAVKRYDGYVVQSTGDGIFALFGAPVSHEDHPQRALYAALRLQEELKRYSDRMRQEGKLPLQARIGVNTGEVVVRSIETGDAHTEYTPIGHTANLAARMQVLAPIGSIAATEQVRKLCGLLPFQRSWSYQSQRHERADRRLRGHRLRTVAPPAAARGGPRVHKVRRAAARDGGAQGCRQAGQARAWADRCHDGGGWGRQVAVVVRGQGDLRRGLDE